MDGLAALFGVRDTSGSGKTLSLTLAGLRDLGRQLTRRAPYLAPIEGPVGSSAVISAPGSQEGYEAITGSTFRNEMCARSILRIAFNWPVRFAAKVNCSALLVAAEQDEVAPVRSVHKVGRIMGEKAEVLSLDCGHFDIYAGEWFEKSMARQVGFLQRILAP